MFVVKRGFLDGTAGFLVSFFSSLYLFVLYAKMWEQQRRISDGPASRGH
jgi:hypothetical protein